MNLVAKLEGHLKIVTQAVVLTKEDGVLSISEDKTIRIWLKRDRGNYWPSVYHLLPFVPSCFELDEIKYRLFVGLENGTISEFTIANDFNRIEHKRYFSSHQGRVTGLLHSDTCNLLLSIGRDKQLHWDDSVSGIRLGSCTLESSCTALQFDSLSRHVFISDRKGQILMLKLEENNSFKHVTTLQGHMGPVCALLWEPMSKWLFSAGSDNVIICWDIGSRKGTAYTLQGHRGKVRSLRFDESTKTLLSAGEDCSVVAWNMEAKRLEAPQWLESDICQRCSKPFFWNLRAMYETMTLGLRQHHCRNCGKAICGDCSSHRITIPKLGFELLVRICDDCFPMSSEASRKPLARIQRVPNQVNCMDFNETKGTLLTSDHNRTITLYSLSCPDWAQSAD